MQELLFAGNTLCRGSPPGTNAIILLPSAGIATNHGETNPSGLIDKQRNPRKFSVEDRQEPVQNVLAGTRCFPDLRKRLSDSIKEPERDRLAMVTCNVGCGYLQRALKLTGQKGLDPSLWVHVRDTFG